MKKICGRLATSLRKSNLRPGDTIAVVLPNLPEYAFLLLAASEAGVRVNIFFSIQPQGPKYNELLFEKVTFGHAFGSTRQTLQDFGAVILKICRKLN